MVHVQGPAPNGGGPSSVGGGGNTIQPSQRNQRRSSAGLSGTGAGGSQPFYSVPPTQQSGAAGGGGTRTCKVRAGQNFAASELSGLPIAGAKRYLMGKAARSYWLFLPSAGSTKPAPVVFFMHGWMAIDPFFYGGWIDHLLGKGCVVVYPTFQTSKSDTPESMRQNALLSLKDSVSKLNSGSFLVQPDWNLLSVVGHSFGGGLSTLIASDASSAGLPIPRFVMALAPGWRGRQIPSYQLENFPPSTYLLIVEGKDDELASSRQASVILNSTSHLPESHKKLIVLRTDSNIPINHSSPLAPLEAYRNPTLSAAEVRRQKISTFVFNRLLRQQPGVINFVDRNGYWNLFDRSIKALRLGKSPFSILETTFKNVSGDGSAASPFQGVVIP